MNQLAARDAVTSSLKRVTVDERAGYATPAVFAVFADHEPDAALMGLVTLEQAGRFSQRIFADLLPQDRAQPVLDDDDLATVADHLEAAPTGALPVLDHDGQLVGAVTRESLWAAMLNQQRALLGELATSEAQQRAMLGAIPDELLCVDAEGRLLAIGRRGDSAPVPERDSAGVPSSHLEPEDSMGKRIAEVFSPEVAATLKDGVQHTLESGKPWHASFSVSQGDTVSQYEARFVTWGEGNVLIICRDVTEVNALRAKLVMSDRMVSVGTLAAGVAHEINNPLTYVSNNLDLLRALFEPEIQGNPAYAEAAFMFDDIRDGVDRVARTVRDLKLFSRSEEPARAVTDVKEVLHRVLRIANNEIRHRAKLTLDLAAAPLVDANEGQLGQVFLNLLVNAAQSIAEGAADENEIGVTTRTDARGRAVIEIRDTGAGIPDELKTRIFAPFFTTKEPGSGTGLGLSICHGIIVAHGGEIELESTVGKGSLFRVVLPPSSVATSPAPVARPRSKARVQIHPPTGRFLVVDDEPAILKTYPRFLGNDQCVARSSGREALELLQHGERFDAILCDLMMPQMSGMELYDELARSVPEQAGRVIFVTGGAFTERARQFLAARTNQTLEKPFDAKHLFACVNTVLEQAK